MKLSSFLLLKMNEVKLEIFKRKTRIFYFIFPSVINSLYSFPIWM